MAAEVVVDLRKPVRCEPSRITRSRRREPFLNRASQVRILPGAQENSDPIAPTEDDYRYLRYERAYIADCEAEREAQVRVVRALLDAAAVPGSASSVEVFGAVITIVVESEGDDASEMLNMAFDFTSFEERGRFPVDVIGFVPGYESIDDWDILPPLRPGDPECWFTYVSPAWVEWLSTAVELDELLEEAAPRRRQRHPSMANWRIGLQPPW